ncbi:MAG TPA: 30S ribosomal protein S12 [Candidatus Norongarragalinales archaeon]|nr:30S ribosomal protein S12 [Candidatus Norongarragalinales archaeon]
MARGLFAGRKLKRDRQAKRWLKKPWKRKALGLKAKFDPLEGAPLAKGIVIKKEGAEQKQPHSGIIKIVRVQLIKNGKKVGAHAPKDKAILQIDEHDEVTIAGLGGSQRGQMGSIPGIRYKVVAVNGINLDQLRLKKKEKPKR